MSASRNGILLINLGTPDAPTAAAVRPYLREFLSDPRVVELPRWLWWPILHGVILNARPKKSAAKYAQIWTQEGSPLLVHTRRQAALLEAETGVAVEAAMRYGNPSIPAALKRLAARGCARILALPLYPQYSASTTATAFDAVFAALTDLRDQPAIRTVRDFHDHPGYIAALAASVRTHWAAHGQPDCLVMSFHGVPRAVIEKGDPYRDECLRTGTLLAQALGLGESRYRITFQSRFGRTEWLQPYTAETLAALGKQGVARVEVVCPGFVGDCLETLEEIALEGKAIFLGAGGREYRYLPALNEDPAWIGALAGIARENLAGWASSPG